ncbi:MAG: undecaprenyl-diphosphate phosphatase [Candidatus Eisenbacteria bacterium]
MTPWQAAVLGVIQGLSEFLPISSSAHLALAHWLTGWGDPSQNVPFDVALHLGTLVAVLAYFRSDWIALFRGSFAALGTRTVTPELARMGILVLATIPAVIFGLLFRRQFEAMHDWPPLMAATLAGVGLLLFALDSRPVGTRTEPGAGRGFAIGVAQALALVPGVSRSGITIAAGLALGLTRPAAARFSFLLSTPAILGAAVLNARDMTAGDPVVLAAGLLTAGVSGYLAIGFLLRHLTRVGFLPYALYRIALAVVILIVWLTRSS